MRQKSNNRIWREYLIKKKRQAFLIEAWFNRGGIYKMLSTFNIWNESKLYSALYKIGIDCRYVTEPNKTIDLFFKYQGYCKKWMPERIYDLIGDFCQDYFTVDDKEYRGNWSQKDIKSQFESDLDEMLRS